MNDQTFYNIDLSELFNSLGLTGLTDEQKVAYTEKIKSLLEGRLFLRLAELLSEEDAQALETKSEDEVVAFLSEKGINYVEIAMEEAQAVREEMISHMAYSKGVIDTLKSNEQ